MAGVRFTYTVTDKSALTDEDRAMMAAVDAYSKKQNREARSLKAALEKAVSAGGKGEVGITFTVTDKDGNVIQQQSAGLEV